MSPIDASIYGQQQPFRLNTPFETLGQIAQLQQHQQVLQSAKTLDQERQQQIAQQQFKLEQEQQQAKATQLLGQLWQQHTAPDPQTGRPATDHQAVINGLMAVSPSVAKTYATMAGDIDKTMWEIHSHQQTYAKGLTDATNGLVDKLLAMPPEERSAGWNIQRKALLLALPEAEQHLPEQYPGDQALKQMQDEGLTQSERIAKGLKLAETASHAATAANAAAELPEKKAKAALAQQVYDNSYGGMTPEQHQQADDAAARLKVSQGQLGVSQAELGLRQKAATAKAAGKPLPAIEADKISDIDKSLSTIRDLRESIGTGSTGFMARAEASLVPNAMADLIPGAAAAKSTQADIVKAQQIVGRIIHGGVMRKNDAEAAAQYLPQLGDAPSVIKSKLDAVEKLALKTRTDHLSNLGKSGYDVSNFAAADTAEAPAAAAATAAPKLAAGKVQRVVQDGVTYEVATDPLGNIISQRVVR